jgi:RHS repeat-associated protein
MKKFAAVVTLFVYIAGIDPLYVYAVEPQTNGAAVVCSEREQKKNPGQTEGTENKESGKEVTEPAVELPSSEIIPEINSSLIKASAGGCIVLGDAEIDIPAGALDHDTEISITRLVRVAGTGDELQNVTAGSGGYRFLPAGTKFKTDVTVKLPYDPSLNSKKAAFETLHTWYYDTKAQKWMQLERKGIDRQNCVLESVTTHFTDMINGTLALPESQSPLDFNINSIKNLEAADPQAGIVPLRGLEGGPSGDASFRYELPLTAGRAGMTPSVAVTYSSGGGSGICGKGFDVQYGSVITTDTRLGLPEYEGADRYMKDGILLKRKTVKESSGTKIYEYTCEKQTAYEKILRYRSSSDDYWVVLEKNGRTEYYGNEENSWTGAGSKLKKFSWYLTKESDPYGNSIAYTYEKDGDYVYPSEIRYTDHGGDKGNYTVAFSYETSENGSYIRPDVRTDGRGKFISICGWRLSDIETKYSGNTVKRYHFAYAESGETYDAAWTSLLKKFEVYSGSSTTRDYGYEFTYKGLEKDTDGKPQYFAEQEQWTGAGPLHVSNGNSTGVSASLSAGVGYGLDAVDVRLTGGGQAASTSSESWTGDMLSDMNGDGKPDLVYQKNDTLYIASNTGTGFSGAEGVPVESGDIDAERGSSNSYGWNVYGGVGTVANIAVGGTTSQVYQSGSSRVTRSIMDINGDGLPDIAESGKNYYLKNNGATGSGGTVSFTKTYYGAGSAVSDTEIKLTDDEIKNYNANYYVQTPFRVWRAPFDGTVSIEQTVTGKSAEIRTLLFEGTDTKGTALVTGACVTDGDDAHSTASSVQAYRAAADKEFYFIEDTGRDTRKKDTDWNIKITYTKIKPLLVSHVPLYFPLTAEDSLTKTVEAADYETESYPAAADILGSEALAPLYSVTHAEPVTVQGSSGSTVTYNLKTTLTLKENWEDGLTDGQLDAACSELIAEKRFVPAVLNSADFDTVKEKCTTDEELQYLAQSYEYDCTTSLYYLKSSGTAEEKLMGMFPDGVLADAVQLYKPYDDIVPLWCGKKVLYESRPAEETTGSRTEKGTGSVLEKGTVIPLGEFNGKKIRFVTADDGSAKVESTDGTYSWNAETSVADGTERITAHKAGTDIVFTLSGYNSRTEPVFASEMKDIQSQSRFAVENTDITAAAWQKDFATADALPAFIGGFKKADGSAYFRDSGIKTIEDSLYTYTEVVAKDGSKTYYWKLKAEEEQDRETAQELLSGYADYVFFKEQFPYYTESSDGTYYTLNEEWRTEKTKKDYTTTIKNSDDSTTEIVDENGWNAYSTNNTLIKSMLELEKIGRYETVCKKLAYDSGYEYEVSNNTFTMEILGDDGFEERSEPFGCVGEYGITGYGAEWNSSTGFSNENMVVPPELGTITKDGKQTALCVNTKESLYGGKNGWYYGIWKGTLSDNSFSAERLYSSTSSVQSTNEAGFNSGKNTDYETAAKNADEHKDDTLYYLPSKNVTTIANQDGDPETESASVTTENESTKVFTISSNVLIGNVANIAKNVTAWKGTGENAERVTKAESTTYAPFIEGDYIHCNRAGGPAYYEIPGIPENSADSSSHQSFFTLPALRKSSNSGTDKTWGISASVGGLNVSAICDAVKALSAAINSSDTSSLATGSMQGTNAGSSSMLQNVQDMNGDGIPDIVQGNGPLSITYGARDEDGTVTYGKRSNTIDAISSLNSNENSTATTGGTFSSWGSVSPVCDSKGRVISENLHGGGNGSSGYVVSNGTSKETAGFTDINGDGLPDYLNGGVLINEGDSFVSQPSCSTYSPGNLSEIKNKTFGMNLELGTALSQANSLNCGVGAGLGLNYSANASNTEKMLLDINGDGLPDLVKKTTGSGTSVTVCYNTGSGFTGEQTITIPAWNIDDSMKYTFGRYTDGSLGANFLTGIPIVGSSLKDSGAIGNLTGSALNPFGLALDKYADSLDFSTTLNFGISGNLAVNFNFGFRIVIFCVYIGTINVTVDANGGVSGGASLTGASVKMQDMDGDGYADQVMRIPGDNGGLWVKRNLMGGADLVSGIECSTGETWGIGYEMKYGTSDMPQSKYVMNSVTVSDGCGEHGLEALPHGEHSITTKYAYGAGYYNRMTKDFYGYSSVTRTDADGGYVVTDYYNDEYYRKEMVNDESTYTKDGTLLKYSEQTLYDSPEALVKSSLNETYEENSSGKMTFLDEYEYDEYGNVTKITETMNGSAYRTAEITYWDEDNTSSYTTPYIYLHSHPETISVYGADGTLLRKRTGTYNDTYGTLKSLKQYRDSTSYLTNTFTYDDCGNMSSMSDTSGVTITYTYDSTDHQYITAIRQKGAGTAASYASGADWYHETGAKKSETDINGNVMRYAYDAQWRLTEVWSPYDTGSMPAVQYAYYTYDNLDSSGTHALWYTVTDNKITFEAGDNSVMETAVVTDGMDRKALTAKRGEKYDTGSGSRTTGWNVSGCMEYDEKGREIKQYMNRFVEGDLSDLLSAVYDDPDGELYTANVYDALDRVTEQTLPDGSVQTTEYAVSDSGERITTVTDPEGNRSVQYADPVENITETEREDKTGKELTKASYVYDEMGQMTEAYDAQKNAVTAVYNMLGQKTSLESKDTGKTNWYYDDYGRMLREDNPVLRGKGEQIKYAYDSFNRLIKTDFPESTDIVQEYGASGAEGNGAGKVVSRTDESGTVTYEYGKLGEMTQETRSIVRAGGYDSVTAVTGYESDYLGRMQHVAYPDGETVTYTYDTGGNVQTVTGVKEGYDDFNYVKDIGYDEYGQRVYISYGNGTHTTYTYDPARRWLKSLVTESEEDGVIQNMQYTFDTVGNVGGYTNSCNGWNTSQDYSYDSLYQLIKVEGSTENKYATADRPSYNATYSQSFAFSSDGLCNMTGKTSKESEVLEDDLNYTLAYTYDSSYAHRAVQAGKRYYKYDSNGNLIREQDKSFADTDSSDEVTYHLIKTEADNVYSSDYAWARMKGGSTAYAGTKSNYYYRDYTWNERNLLSKTKDDSFTTEYLYGGDGQRAVKRSSVSETLYFNKFFTQRYDDAYQGAGGRMSKHIFLGNDRIVTKQVALGTGETYDNADTAVEKLYTYYYHADHLGSTSVVTDHNGEVYERLEYTPYGETWLDETNGDTYFDTPYRFSAKEKDEETGLYYYGARYLDPKYSRWISADPALGDYLPQAPINDEAKKHNQSLPGQGGVFNVINLNLYHYAGNNPIKYTDPDGSQVAVTPYGPILVPVLPMHPIQPSKPLQPPSPSNGRILGDNWSADAGQKKENENTEADQVKAGLEGSAQSAAPSPVPQNDDRVRGLPPSGTKPPVEGNVTPGDASRPSEKNKGGKSLWDENGGEWRYFPEDKYHNPHWDYNPHDVPNSAWQNVPIDNKPVEK